MKLEVHPLAFSKEYSLFLYLLFLGFTFFMFSARIDAFLSSKLGFLASFGKGALWFLLVMIPLIAYSFATIHWSLSIIGFIICCLIFLHPILPGLSYLFCSIYGWLGLLITDLYRKGFHYEVGEECIKMEHRFIREAMREVKYEHITDLILHQGVLGRLFDFGSILVLTPSGIGTGEDIASIYAGAGIKRKIFGFLAFGALRGVKVPRARSYLMLFGIKKPKDVLKIIEERWRKS